MTAPIEHIEDALKLEGDYRVDLWEVKLHNSNTYVRFWNGPTRTWQGKVWEGLACRLSSETKSAEGRRNRPTLTIVNPENLFGPMAAAGTFDLAQFTRRRLLQEHFDADVNIYEQTLYISSRVVAITDQVLQLELRSPLDFPPFKTPRRTFSPPEYPFVVY